MTTLAVDRLITELVQPISLYRETTSLGIKARLYFHNDPSGIFHFKFYKDGVLLKQLDFTTTWSKLQINNLYPYFWIDLAIKETFNLPKGDLVVKLESTGNSFSEMSFVGWCKDFGGHNGIIIGDPKDFTDYPFMFKIIEYKEREQ